MHKTPPRLYFHLNIAKITQSSNLTDAITDDSYSNEHLVGLNGVIYLYRSKASNVDFIPMTNRLRTTLLNRQNAVESEYVFPGRYGGHKSIQNNRALEAAF